MHPEVYRREAMRTECDQHKAGDRLFSNTDRVRLNYSVIGMLNELGEVGSLLQKAVYYGVPFTPEELRQKLCDELGDLFWYFNQALTAAGLTLDQVMEANLRKLRTRYPDKFDLDRRLNRDQDAEEKAVNAVSVARCPRCHGHKRLEHSTTGVESDCPDCGGKGFVPRQPI